MTHDDQMQNRRSGVGVIEMKCLSSTQNASNICVPLHSDAFRHTGYTTISVIYK